MYDAYLTPLEVFLVKVVLDGRYIDEVTVDPQGVADVLGAELSAAELEGLRGCDAQHTYAAVMDRLTRQIGDHCASTGKQMIEPTLGVGTSIAIIGVSIASIVIVEIVCGFEETEIVDESEHADDKL